MAANAYRNYKNNVGALKKDVERLSSGYRINRAGDDAAGLAISEKMRAQITGLETAQKNAKEGITLVQTAEGALTEVHDMLNRIVELATQSANGTYDDAVDRFQLQKEIDQLRDEIDRIAVSTNFNGIKLLDGSLGKISSIITNTVTSTIDQSYNTGDRVNLTVGGDLPDVGKGTVLHDETLGEGGARYNKEMSVDLSGVTWDTSADDKTLTIGVGDVTFKLTAKTAQGKLQNDALIEAILGRNKDVDVEITDSNGARPPITGGSGTGEIELTLDGQEVTVKKSNDGKKLHFALKNTPTSTDDELKVAETVTINGVESAGIYTEYHVDLLQIFTQGVFDYESKVTIFGKEYVFREKEGTSGYNDVEEFAEYVASQIKAELTSTANAQKFDVIPDGNTGFTLRAQNFGDLDISAVLPEIVVQRAEKVGAKGIAAIRPGVDQVNAKYTFSIKLEATDLGVCFNRKVYSLLRKPGENLTYAEERFINDSGLTYAGFENLEDLVAALQEDLSETQDTTWRNFKATVKAGTNGTLEFDLEAKSDGDYRGSSGNNVSSAIEDQLYVFTVSNTDDGYDRRTGSASRYGDEGANGIYARHSFSLSEDWIQGTAIEICGTKFDIGNGASDMSNNELGQLTVGDRMYYVLYTAETKTFTLEAVTYGVDTNRLTYAYTRRVGDDETNEIRRTKRGKAEERILGLLTATGGPSGTTGTTGKEQKASTRFRLTEDLVAEGARLRIGEIWYEFIADSSKQGTAKKDEDGNDETDKDGYRTVYVDVSSGDLTEIARNLKTAAAVNAAAGKAVWEVEADKDWIYLTETEAHANLNGNKDLTDYKENCVFDLSTAKGVNDSLDYEGVLRHKLVEVVETKEETVPGHGLILQIGDTNDEFNKLHIYINDCRTKAMAYTDENGNDHSLADISVADQQSAADTIEVVKKVVNYISDVRGQLGAYQNRLEHTINNLSVMTENIQDAESTIRDTDIAELMMEYTKNNILIQASQAMLAQANQVPQSVLQLPG